MANSSFQKSSIATPVAIADGGTGATTQATALDAIADSSSGSADQVLTTDGTNASWEDAGGGGSLSLPIIGTLSAGDPVRIVSDGGAAKFKSLSGIAGTLDNPNPITVQSINMGGEYRLKTAQNTAGDKIVMIYENNSDSKGYVTVGSVTAGAISWGTPVEISSSTSTGDMTVCYDPDNDRFVFFYFDGTNGVCKIGTVSGSTISFNSATTLISGNSATFCAAYNETESKMVVAYKDSAHHANGALYARVATLTTTTVSFGTQLNFNSDSSNSNRGVGDIIYDPGTGHVVVGYLNASASQRVRVLSMSGTTLSTGTMQQLLNNNATGIALTYDSVNGCIIVGYNDSFYNDLYIRIVSVSGTTITLRTGKTIHTNIGDTTGSPRNNFTLYADGNSNVVAVYTVTTTGLFKKETAITDSTTLGTPGSQVTLYSGAEVNEVNSVFNPLNGPVVTYQDAVSSNYYAKYILGDLANFANDFEAVMVEAGTNGQTKEAAIVGGTVTGLSSLTSGSGYYIQSDYSLGTTRTIYKAGIALSATELLVSK